MARKKKVKVKEKVEIRLRLDGDIHDEVNAIAEEERIPIAAYIRSLVMADLKRRKAEGKP
jgi:hypothetical protein